MLGTWADHIIIQAVANSNNLRIHIIEGAPNFAEFTVVSSIYAESAGNVRYLYWTSQLGALYLDNANYTVFQ